LAETLRYRLNMAHTRGLPRLGLWLFLSALLFFIPISSFGAISLTQGEVTDLAEHGQLFMADKEDFPALARDIPAWLSQRQAAPTVNLFGGAYWVYAELRNNSNVTEWIVNPGGTLIDRVEVRLYLQDGTTQGFVTGYQAKHDYMLHYGKSIHLPSGMNTKVLIRFESPYYASEPSFELLVEPDFQQRVLSENVLMLAAFGALLTLALYNLFIFLITLDRTFFYYASYLVAYFLGWAFTFHIPAELFGWRNLHLHYIPFFLLPVLNTLFYMEFLQLKTHFPRLAAISRINFILPLALLPSCFLALPYAHMLATLVITFWLMIALISGIASLRSGFKPARYFVLAFIALLVPGAFILPANVGLIPDLVRNTELFTLLGGTLDAILLAFALADKIRILSGEKDQALKRLSKMLDVARTDHLTRIANRHAFDQAFEEAFVLQENAENPEQLMLVLIDLDGLKRINDHYGHSRGDELLCAFATALARLEGDDITVYRLGGDEFTILARKRSEETMRTTIANLETQLRERGFEEAGISYGIAFASETKSPNNMLTLADRRMYEFKTARRRARSQDGWKAETCLKTP